MSKNLVNRNVNMDFLSPDGTSGIDGDIVNYDVEYSTMNTPNPDIIEDRALAYGVDGKVIKYAVEYSTMNTPNPNIVEDSPESDEFFSANGIQDNGGDDFYDATGPDDTFPDDSQPDPSFDGEDHSNFTLWSKKKRKNFSRKFNKAGKDIGKGFNKFGKNIETGVNKLGKNLEKVGQVGLNALLNSQNGGDQGGAAIAAPMPVEEEKKGWAKLSTPAKVGIIVGGVAVISTIAYFALRKRK